MLGKRFLVGSIFFFFVKLYFFGESLNLTTSQFFLTSAICCNSISIYENVFENNEKSSELKWDSISPCILCSIGYSYKGFSSVLAVDSAIPIECGKMTDKDFFLNGTGAISLFSRHDVITDKDYSFILDLNYSRRISSFFFSLSLRGLYSNIKLESDDGYLQYPAENKEWNGTEKTEPLNGTAVTYEQSRFIAGFGVQIGSIWGKNDRFKCCFSFLYYPFVQIKAIDNHFLRMTQFCDLMKTGDGFDFELSLRILINEKLNIKTSFMDAVINANGETYINSIGIITQSTTKSSNTCSVSTKYNKLSFTLGLVYKI